MENKCEANISMHNGIPVDEVCGIDAEYICVYWTWRIKEQIP